MLRSDAINITIFRQFQKSSYLQIYHIQEIMTIFNLVKINITFNINSIFLFLLLILLFY